MVTSQDLWDSCPDKESYEWNSSRRHSYNVLLKEERKQKEKELMKNWEQEIQRLKLLIIQKNYNQREASIKMGVDEKELSKFLNPKNSPLMSRYWDFKEKIEKL